MQAKEVAVNYLADACFFVEYERDDVHCWVQHYCVEVRGLEEELG